MPNRSFSQPLNVSNLETVRNPNQTRRKLIQLTMTPKLRLSDEARKALLSSILKVLLLVKRRTNISTQMKEAPEMQAVHIIEVSTFCFYDFNQELLLTG